MTEGEMLYVCPRASFARWCEFRSRTRGVLQDSLSEDVGSDALFVISERQR